jgi:hypothetical protein
LCHHLIFIQEDLSTNELVSVIAVWQKQRRSDHENCFLSFPTFQLEFLFECPTIIALLFTASERFNYVKEAQIILLLIFSDEEDLESHCTLLWNLVVLLGTDRSTEQGMLRMDSIVGFKNSPHDLHLSEIFGLVLSQCLDSSKTQLASLQLAQSD